MPKYKTSYLSLLNLIKLLETAEVILAPNSVTSFDSSTIGAMSVFIYCYISCTTDNFLFTMNASHTFDKHATHIFIWTIEKKETDRLKYRQSQSIPSTTSLKWVTDQHMSDVVIQPGFNLAHMAACALS